MNTCRSVYVCEFEHRHATACLEVRGQPWVFEARSLVHCCTHRLTNPPLSYLLQMVCFMWFDINLFLWKDRSKSKNPLTVKSSGSSKDTCLLIPTFAQHQAFIEVPEKVIIRETASMESVHKRRSQAEGSFQFLGATLEEHKPPCGQPPSQRECTAWRMTSECRTLRIRTLRMDGVLQQGVFNSTLDILRS